MPHPDFESLIDLARRDRRYRVEAYVFVFEALEYAQRVLGLGKAHETAASPAGRGEPEEARQERHVTGQELCDAARRFAWDQYGLMAGRVLGSWGIHSTSDLGEIVYNLINVQQMRKTEQDRREDFDNVFDWSRSLVDDYKIALPPA
jgi:uncharacterized repeat protein (TIGR04138 family)